MDAHTTDDAPAARAAQRRRRRWPLRLLGWLLVLILLAGGARLVWGVYADWRLDALVKERRARGERVLFQDFTPQPVPDEENGALQYLNAVNRIQDPNGVLITAPNLADVRSKPAEVRVLLALNDTPLQLARAARELPETNWGTTWLSPAIGTLLPHLSPARQLARLEIVAALQAQIDGDGRAALDYCGDVLDLAQRLDASEPTLVTHNVRMALERTALGALEEMLPELRIGDGDTHGVAQAGVRAYGRRLLDENDLRRAAGVAFTAERSLLIDAAQCLSDGRLGVSAIWSMTMGGPPGWSGPVSDTTLRWAIGPAWKLEAARLVPEYDAAAAAAAMASWPAAEEALPEGRTASDTYVVPLGILPSWSAGNYAGWLKQNFELRASRRLAATALALRAYTTEHGQRPGTLDALVPAHLDAVPVDPFSAAGEKVRYRLDGPAPCVYSIGPDGRDDGGLPAFRERRVDLGRYDILFYLAGRPARTTDSAPAVTPE